MARFKLLATKHTGRDPAYVLQPDGKFKGPDGRLHTTAPDRVFSAGDVVESETDLAAQFGREKFELLDGEPTAASQSTAVFPAGQVFEGMQRTVKDREGRHLSGVMVEEPRREPVQESDETKGAAPVQSEPEPPILEPEE